MQWRYWCVRIGHSSRFIYFDSEDAPGPAALHSFHVALEHDQIFVTADTSQTTPAGKARPPKALISAEEPGPGVVIVGGGSGAYGVVESLREFGYKKSITIISKEPHAPIDRLAPALFDISCSSTTIFV